MAFETAAFVSRVARAAAILCIGTWSCAQAAGAGEGTSGSLEQHLAHCTSEFGYSPQAAQGLGPHELGTNELAWRDCAYQGIEDLVIPNSEASDLYRQIIDEDRAMTAKIGAMEMTRAERKARLDALIASIREKEEKAVAAKRMELRTVQNVQRSMMRMR